MSSRGFDAPDQRGGRTAAEAIALMGALGVVIAHEAVKGSLQRRARREVAPPEGHAPELLQNRALQALAEAVGPGLAGFGPRVLQAGTPTGDIKGALEIRTAVG